MQCLPKPYRELLKDRQEKNYHELALESLQRQISLFYKIFKENKPLPFQSNANQNFEL